MLCPAIALETHDVETDGEGRTIAQIANIGAESSVELTCLECGHTSTDEATREAFKETGD